jgi:replicative DNA helicase
MNLSGHIPPQDANIESAVIGALLLDQNALFGSMDRIFREMFYQESNALIFDAIQAIYDDNGKVDIFTVADRLNKMGKLEQAGGVYGITKVTKDVVSGANIQDHVLILSELYLKRETIRISQESSAKGYDPEVDAFDLVTKTGVELERAHERVVSGMSRDITYFSMKVLEQHAAVKETGVLGIKTGIAELDRTICGLVSPDLIVIAARPGQGKTALALSITHNTSVLRDVPCAWFSLEMDGVQLVRRLACIHSGLDHERVRNGHTTEAEDKKLHDAIAQIASKKIFIEDKTSANIRDIKTRATVLKRKEGIEYIVVDYMQLMEGIDVKGKSREAVVSEIARGLKCLAKDLEIPIIALSQLSREVEKRGDKMPQLSDLRESGAIEQDADIVLFLMRPSYYGFTDGITIGHNTYEADGLCIVNRAKNRHGDTGNSGIGFTGKTMKFHDYENQLAGNWKPVEN